VTGVLVVAEHLKGRLRDPSLEAVTAAGELGGPVTVLVVAADPQALVPAVSVEGFDR